MSRGYLLFGHLSFNQLGCISISVHSTLGKGDSFCTVFVVVETFGKFSADEMVFLCQIRPNGPDLDLDVSCEYNFGL